MTKKTLSKILEGYLDDYMTQDTQKFVQSHTVMTPKGDEKVGTSDDKLFKASNIKQTTVGGPQKKHGYKNPEDEKAYDPQAEKTPQANKPVKEEKKHAKDCECEKCEKEREEMKEEALSEKTLTPAEMKKREEIARAMERQHPGMDKSKKMAIATAAAKRVAEAAGDITLTTTAKKSDAEGPTSYKKSDKEGIPDNLKDRLPTLPTVGNSSVKNNPSTNTTTVNKSSKETVVGPLSKFYTEATLSPKAARAGKDIGKPGKNFEKIAKSAAKRYGSEEAGKRVAGAILAKMRAKKIHEATVQTGISTANPIVPSQFNSTGGYTSMTTARSIKGDREDIRPNKDQERLLPSNMSSLKLSPSSSNTATNTTTIYKTPANEDHQIDEVSMNTLSSVNDAIKSGKNSQGQPIKNPGRKALHVMTGMAKKIASAVKEEENDDGWYAHREIHGNEGVSREDWKKGIRLNSKGERVQTKKKVSEETLDEISNRAKSAYLGTAVADLTRRSQEHGYNVGKNKKNLGDNPRKIMNRQDGIYRATKGMRKEDVESVDEAKRGRPSLKNPEQNIEPIQTQLQKMHKQHEVDVTFADKSTHKIPREHANKALKHLSSLKPIHRDEAQKQMSASKQGFYDTLAGKKQEAKPKITLAKLGSMGITKKAAPPSDEAREKKKTGGDD